MDVRFLQVNYKPIYNGRKSVAKFGGTGEKKGGEKKVEEKPRRGASLYLSQKAMQVNQRTGHPHECRRGEVSIAT